MGAGRDHESMPPIFGTIAAAARILCVDRRRVEVLLREGRLRSRSFPGGLGKVEVDLDDARRMAAGAVAKAG